MYAKIRITLLRLLNGAAKNVSVDGIDELQLQPDGIVHTDGEASHHVHDVAGGYGNLHGSASFRIAVRLCDRQDIGKASHLKDLHDRLVDMQHLHFTLLVHGLLRRKQHAKSRG